MRFLICCELCDAPAITTCLEGLKAHADIEFMSLNLVGDHLKTAVIELISSFKSLESCWYSEFPNHSSLETFCQLMESIPFTQEEFIRIAFPDPCSETFKIWTLEQFHKAVIVEGFFRGA